MRFEPATTEDLDEVSRQLGRRPNRVVGVASRCPAGHPSVVVNYPLQGRGDREAPFPTLFWVTCRQLTKSISRLEMAGLIGELDARLAADDDLANALRANHEDYVARRNALFTEADLETVRTAGWADMFRACGIGGLRNWRSVKCLHAHFAHHLATGNAIGALLAAEHGIRCC